MSGESSLTDRIINTVSLQEYISQYVALTKRGNNFSGLCPFHAEKTPSFTVNETKHFFYCFGCQESGNIFQFAMRYHNLSSFREALEQVASYAGITLDAQTFRKLSKREKLASDLKSFLQDVALCYQKEGKVPNNPGMEYLQQRRISKSSIENFFLGYAPQNPSFLASHLSLSQYGETVISISQLFFSSPSSYQDKFRNRIVFPIQNVKGDTIAFGFRSLQPNAQPKYINSSENPLFKKREVLYGLYQAKEEIKKSKTVYVTEGYFDVIALHEKGVVNAVATMGTSITSSHIENLLTWADHLIFLFDGDTAGRKAAHKALFLCLKKDMAPKIALCEDQKDPYDMVQIYGDQILPWLQRHTQNWEDFLLGEIEREPSPIQQKKITRKYLEDLTTVSPFLSRSLEKKIQERFSPSSHSFRPPSSSYKQTPQPFEVLSHEEKTRQLEISFLCLALFYPLPLEQLREKMSVGVNFFHSEEARIIFDILEKNPHNFSLPDFLSELPLAQKEKIEQEYQKLNLVENHEKALYDCYYHLLISDLTERAKEIKRNILASNRSSLDHSPESFASHFRELETITKRQKDLEKKIRTL